jgi:hypothetical protein
VFGASIPPSLRQSCDRAKKTGKFTFLAAPLQSRFPRPSARTTRTPVHLSADPVRAPSAPILDVAVHERRGRLSSSLSAGREKCTRGRCTRIGSLQMSRSAALGMTSKYFCNSAILNKPAGAIIVPTSVRTSRRLKVAVPDSSLLRLAVFLGFFSRRLDLLHLQ